MKALENRTKESKREMDIMAALDEMRTLKQLQFKVGRGDRERKGQATIYQRGWSEGSGTLSCDVGMNINMMAGPGVCLLTH